MIIKNCTSYKTYYPDTGAEPFSCCDAELPYKKCQDCDNCLLKQIVKECRDEKELPLETRGDLAERILSLFEIEEE